MAFFFNSFYTIEAIIGISLVQGIFFSRNPTEHNINLTSTGLIWEVFTVIDKNIEDTEKVEKSLKSLEKSTVELATRIPRKKHLSDAQSPNSHSGLFEKVNLEGKETHRVLLEETVDPKKNRRFTVDHTNDKNLFLSASAISLLSKFGAEKITSREESHISFFKPLIGQAASELTSPQKNSGEQDINNSLEVAVEAMNRYSQYEKGTLVSSLIMHDLDFTSSFNYVG